MVISLLKIVGKYTKLFLGSQIIGCVFMKNAYYRKIPPKGECT